MIPIGLNVLFWSVIGFFRYINDRDRKSTFRKKGKNELSPDQIANLIHQVAVCLPAHNEAIVIVDTIESLRALLPVEQIFVISDGSIDHTAALARSQGCQVLELETAHGKAGALEAVIKHFDLYNKFKYIVMADADTIFEKDYLKNALRIFNSNPKVAAIAGYTKSAIDKSWWPSLSRYFVAYRSRQYLALQSMVTYGQTWNLTSVTPVIPGFASIYRSEILRQLKIAVPGIAIEDFNLAFQIQKKNLGLIAHHPSVSAITQDPDNLTDYINQITRWNTGFWQTVKYWRVWPSVFWLSLGAFIAELLLFSVFLPLAPVVLAIMTLVYAHYFSLPIAGINQAVGQNFFGLIWGFYLGIFIIDYLITVLFALKARQWSLLFYGPAFVFIRIIDAMILLTSTPLALLKSSTGKWISPVRRAQKIA